MNNPRPFCVRFAVTSAAVLAIVAVSLTIALPAAAGIAGSVAVSASSAKKKIRYCTGIEKTKKAKAGKAIEARQKTKTTGYVYLCKKSGKRYVLQQGPYRAKFGYNGTTSKKREGDGRTPKGVYWMRNGFATTKNPRLGKSWTKTTRDHVWVDGKASTKRGYSTMERKTQGYLGDSLDQYKLYKYAQVIGYDEARTPGMGSAIFLNENTESMKTANCISLYEVGLKKVMRWEGKTKIQSVNH